MKWGDYVRLGLARKDWLPARLAREAKVDPSSLSEILSNQTLGRGDTVAKIQYHLGLDAKIVNRLMRGEDVDISEAQLPPLQERLRELSVQASNIAREIESAGTVAFTGDLPLQITRASDLHTFRVPRMVQVPSAGPGSMADAEYVEFTTYERPTSANLIAVTISGTCLEPQVMHGATVIVDTGHTVDIPAGSVVVALHDGELLAKWLEIRGDERWLTSNTHPPIRANGETRILGILISIPPPHKH